MRKTTIAALIIMWPVTGCDLDILGLSTSLPGAEPTFEQIIDPDDEIDDEPTAGPDAPTTGVDGPDVVHTAEGTVSGDDQPDVCEPNCAGAQCGPDGCGGSCGSCPAGAPLCVVGQCESACVPSCDGLTCGDDGCGGVCGTCGADAPLCVAGSCVVPAPGIDVVPHLLNLGHLDTLQPTSGSLMVINTGTDTLTLTAVQVTGHAGMSFQVGGAQWKAGNAASIATLPTPVVIDAGSLLEVPVTFSTSAPGIAQAAVAFFSDASGMPSREVNVVAQVSGDGPCLDVDPPMIDLRGVPMDGVSGHLLTLTACGDAPVTLTGLVWGTSPPTGFNLDKAGSGLEDAHHVLMPGESTEVALSFLPVAEGDWAGKIAVKSDGAMGSQVWVPFRATSTAAACPEPVIQGPPGDHVPPFVPVTVDGRGSVADDAVGGYSWTLEAPEGSQATLSPASVVPNPTFVPDVVGTYVVRLVVTDGDGLPSCDETARVVTVVPDADVYIELTWDAAGAGAGPPTPDLDLHVAHPNAVGEDNDGDGLPDKWYVQPWDCFWFNPNPQWGAGNDLDDDPVLLTGPGSWSRVEAVRIDAPESNTTYDVAIHHWTDHGQGAVDARLRVYIHGSLSWEATSAPLESRDLWHATRVSWPSGAVFPVSGSDGGFAITPDYQSAAFPAP